MLAATKRNRPRLRLRYIAVLLLDVCTAVFALHLALALRVGYAPARHMIDGAWLATPIVIVITLAAHLALGLRLRLWRYASIPDLILTLEMATIVAGGTALVLYVTGEAQWMPRSLPAIYWLVMAMSFASLRVARRLASEFMRGTLFPPHQTEFTSKTVEYAIFAGQFDRVEMLLRANERHPLSAVRPIGILADLDGMEGVRVRGVPVLGVLASLDNVLKGLEAEGRRPVRLIFAETAERLRKAPFLQLVAKAEGLGLKLSCLPTLDRNLSTRSPEAGLRSIDLSELLDRPQTELDSTVARRSITGRRVLVTGAGGSIGRELVRQITSFEPAQIILLDASEFGLYEVDLEVKEKHPSLSRAAVLCSVRQRSQLMKVFEKYRPELVFHAAALKHVPMVEQHPCAGVQTNVLGTRNVADAANKYGAQVLIQVSTDKAVNPVGMMGATKRLGELYCQALDIAGSRSANGARFLTVRFGNVLGSSGSLIPLFQKQLDAGQPLTVTHPEIERFFMTIQEAVQLVLQASGRALTCERGRIFVLDMGEPVKVLDIARRMIRLAGKEPEREVKIEIVGLRPGEKLYEELFNESERRLPSPLPRIFEAAPDPQPLHVLNSAFDRLQLLCRRGDDDAVRSMVFGLLHEPKVTTPDDRAQAPLPAWPASYSGALAEQTNRTGLIA